MSRLILHRIALGTLCSAFAVTPAIASTTATVGISFSQSFPNNSDTKYINDYNQLMTPTTSQASYRFDSEGLSSNVSVAGYAYATAGHLAVSAISTTGVKTTQYDSNGDLNGRGGAWGEAWTYASWMDRFTIDAPGLVGQHGTFEATLHLTGIVSASGGGYSDLRGDTLFVMDNSGRANLSLNGTGLDWQSQPWDDACGEAQLACALYNPSSNPAQSYEKGNAALDLPVTIAFTFGLPTSISYGITAYSYAASSIQYWKVEGAGGAESLADMSHTLLWGGIGAVYDAQGNAVTNFNLVSSSSFDYRNAAVVPVPTASWLFVSGLFGMLGYLRRPQLLRLDA